MKSKNNKCYICKEVVKKEFFLIDGRVVCNKCYYNKHIAKEVKRVAKRVFVGV